MPRQIEKGEEQKREPIQFQDVEPAHIGEIIQDRMDHWLMQEEAVIHPGKARATEPNVGRKRRATRR